MTAAGADDRAMGYSRERLTGQKGIFDAPEAEATKP
jgi:hypothetical protein